jgi:hypothetical protein
LTFEVSLGKQRSYKKINNENANVCDIGRDGARHRKYKRLKFGGGQGYDCASDKAAVVT